MFMGLHLYQFTQYICLCNSNLRNAGTAVLCSDADVCLYKKIMLRYILAAGVTGKFDYDLVLAQDNSKTGWKKTRLGRSVRGLRGSGSGHHI